MIERLKSKPIFSLIIDAKRKKIVIGILLFISILGQTSGIPNVTLLDDIPVFSNSKFSNTKVSQPLLLGSGSSFYIALGVYPDLSDVSFVFGTYVRKNSCSLRVLVDKKILSDELKCKDIIDNNYSSFHFNSPLLPGIHEINFISDSSDPSNAVSVYYISDQENQNWIHSFKSSDSKTVAELIFTWIVNFPMRGSVYLLGLVILSILFFLPGKPKMVHWILLVSVLFSANMSMTKMLSGHDETAHIDMFFRSIVHDVEGPKLEEYSKIFNRDVEILKSEESFYALHNVDPLPENTCPHKILGRCGITEKPLWLYRIYSSVLNLDWKNVETPRNLSWIGQGINVLSTILIFVIIFSLYGAKTVSATLPLLILFGAFQSRVSSVTNDYPMFLGGLFITATLYSIISTKVINWRKLFGVLTCLSWLYFFGRHVDRSWICGLPLVFLIGAVVAVIIYNDFQGKSEGVIQLSNPYFILTAYFTGFVGLLLLIPVSYRSFLQTDFIGPLLRSADSHKISYLDKIIWSRSVEGVWENMKSLFGDFVWGHSYYNNFSYMLLFSVFVFLSYQGLREISGIWGKRLGGTFSLMIGGCLAIQILITLSIISLLSVDNVSFPSTTKIRFSAPGLGAWVLLPMIGIGKIVISEKWAKKALDISIIWVLFNSLYYFVLFFIIDAN